MKNTKIWLSLLIAFSLSHAHAQNKNIALPTSLPMGLPPIEATNPYNIPKQLPPMVLNGKNESPSFNFQEMPVSQLISFYFQEINSNSYVLAPDIAQDTRVISLRFDSTKNKQSSEFTRNLIASLGYTIENKSGVYFVTKLPEAKELKKNLVLDIYRPKYKDSNYLINLLRSSFPNAFGTTSVVQNASAMETKNTNPPPGSAAAQIDSRVDTILLHSEDPQELEKVKKYLSLLDIPDNNLFVKANIYEVSYSKKDGSAIGLIMNLASSKLNVQFNSASTLDNVLKFTSSGLSLMFSNIDTDSRFKLLSSPYLRIKNGSTSSLTVGQSVPTLGSVSYQGNSGTPVQNVEYKDSGLVFKLTPTIRQESIDIQLSQQISEVQNTTTGVNTTPTLTKRQLESTFTTKKNEAVILGGLKQEKSASGKSRPFFLPFLSNDNQSQDNTEIIIILEVLSTENDQQASNEATSVSENQSR
ncbi:hypothetical protein ABWL39_20010 [Chitinivorax sp. PXF-14]|uniref:type II secretion system protein GspD n=1 Tax=Chitinivorax sp. PXF-14 TaxID=3230488 RepID=UPI0034670AF6